MGGFGVVYKVYSRELSRVFALKTYRDEYLVDQEVKKRFHKEASVWVDWEPSLSGTRRQWMEISAGFILMEFMLRMKKTELAGGLPAAATARPGAEPALGDPDLPGDGICYSKGFVPTATQTCQFMISQDMTAGSRFRFGRVIGESPALRFASLEPLSGQTMPGAGRYAHPYAPTV